jgi:hypothetical protein
MSTQFKPIEIPPGVVATPTKKQRSSNWSEVNLIRWREGQLMPMGGQAQLSNVVGGVEKYKFASRCKKIHGWFGLDGVYRIAYLTEAHLYVDTGGVLTDISPVPPLVVPSGLVGGYGDDLYNKDLYGTPRSIPSSVAITKIPDAYSLDNFGSKWDPASGGGTVTGIKATTAFTSSSPIIYTTTIPASVLPGAAVFDVTSGHGLGAVSSIAANAPTTTAQFDFYATPSQASVLALPHPVGVGPGMQVTNATSGYPLGTIASYGPLTQTLTATGSWTSGYKACFMPSNPGWAIPGLTVRDLTTSTTLGPLAAYGLVSRTQTTNTSVLIHAGDTTIVMGTGGNVQGWIIPGMDVTEASHLPGWTAKVVSYVGTNLVVDTPVPSAQAYLDLRFDSGARSVAQWVGSSTASLGATDSIQFSSDANEVITFTTVITSASSGANDVLSITGGSKLTLAANSLFASSGATDALNFIGNVASVQTADSGRGPVPNGRCFVVTQERFIVIFGSTNDGTAGGTTGGGPRRFAWCDQENPGAWDYTNVVSMAGWLDVEPASPIITACASRVGTIFWTAKKVYASRFLGSPYIYNYTELADGTVPWSPQSVTTTSSLTLWMSEQGPFSYDGTSVLPVKCMIRPWIDDNIDPVAVRELSFACHVGDYNEWWWFFPTLNSPFNTRAAIYSYKEGFWTQARLSRSAGITSSYTAHPIFADDYVAIQHEIFQATSYVNVSMPVEGPFAESFDLNLASGARLTTVKQLIPDVEALNPTDANAAQAAISNLRYSMFYRRTRSLGDSELQTPKVAVRPDGYVDFRITGRDLRLRIDMDSASVQPFTLGQHLIDSVPRGDR